MARRYLFLRTFVFFVGIFWLLSGCEKQTKEIYETPEWLGGTSIETLTEEGDCNIYLSLMEIAEYTEPITKQLFTLFVPRDSAFRAYFNKIGIESVDELTEDQARSLFTLHVLRNPRSRFQLIYEWVWGELQGPTGEYAALFFRKQTRSISLPYRETVLYDPNYIGENLIIHTRRNKWVPLFTVDFMEDYFASPDGSDYEFLYRDSEWGGMQWHSAMVTEAEVRTRTGFIYYLDRVVEPMPTLEEYLKDNQDKYGLYYELIQRFARYRTNGTNDQDQQVYVKYYTNPMLDIADEAGPSAGDELIRQDLFTAYIPRNDVLQAYLDENVYPYYSSIDSMPSVTLNYIIQSHITDKLGLKSKIEKGIYNVFGDIVYIDPDNDISDAFMCSNGALYEMNKVVEPYVFTTVPGPLFFNSNYSIFLNALLRADMINSISTPEFKVTVFAPDNEQLTNNGIRYNAQDNIMQFLSRSGLWTNFRLEDLEEFVENHIIKAKITDFSGEGYVEMSSRHYVYYNNNVLYGAGNYEDGDNTGFTDMQDNEINGALYYLNNVIKVPDYTAAELIGNDPELSEFYTLLDSSNLLTTWVDPMSFDTLPVLNFLAETDYWTMFLPDNSAVIQARNDGDIPDDPDLLKDFIFYHFVKGDVIFDNGEKSGIFYTNFIDTVTDQGIVYGELDILNSPGNLQITDQSGQVINVNHDNANKLIDGGVMHKISSIIKHE
ncbi:MAG: fasciclin domain-containing protein [Bacteroidales bacterium]|nr:MAG: fasciclin domain-containing protein [Bacteroidales bacterium]